MGERCLKHIYVNKNQE